MHQSSEIDCDSVSEEIDRRRTTAFMAEALWGETIDGGKRRRGGFSETVLVSYWFGTEKISKNNIFNIFSAIAQHSGAVERGPSAANAAAADITI